ncbi:hypothetical protein D6817_05415 [Candidatus Pacearchaeota archaeon]|nr:MAG: hypothetical protein D6817_05415 [Candidatus Pacearchaeota archaeon]
MIYFIRGKESGNIKIGYSTTPEKRRSNLQTAHYEELELIGLMRGTREDEARIQQMFSQFNIRGEWYRPVEEILDFIVKNVGKQRLNIVESLGDGEYRILFAEPVKFSIKFLLLAGSHNLRVITDNDTELAFGVEGKRETLLNWMDSLEIVTREAMDQFAALMVE